MEAQKYIENRLNILEQRKQAALLADDWGRVDTLSERIVEVILLAEALEFDPLYNPMEHTYRVVIKGESRW